MSAPSPAKKAKTSHINEPVGVILAGIGRIGKVHLKNILGNPRLRLKWIVDVDLKAAQEAAQPLHDVKATSNLDEALHDPTTNGNRSFVHRFKNNFFPPFNK